MALLWKRASHTPQLPGEDDGGDRTLRPFDWEQPVRKGVFAHRFGGVCPHTSGADESDKQNFE